MKNVKSLTIEIEFNFPTCTRHWGIVLSRSGVWIRILWEFNRKLWLGTWTLWEKFFIHYFPSFQKCLVHNRNMKIILEYLRMQSESSSRRTDSEILAIQIRHINVIWRQNLKTCEIPAQVDLGAAPGRISSLRVEINRKISSKPSKI